MLTFQSGHFSHENIDDIDVYIREDITVPTTKKRYWIKDMIESAKKLKLKNIVYYGGYTIENLKDSLIIGGDPNQGHNIINTVTINKNLIGNQRYNSNIYYSDRGPLTIKITTKDYILGYYDIDNNCLDIHALNNESKNVVLFSTIADTILDYGIELGKPVIGFKLVQANAEDLDYFQLEQKKELINLYKDKMSALVEGFKLKEIAIREQQLVAPSFLLPTDEVRINMNYLAILVPITFQTTKMLKGPYEFNVTSLTKKHKIKVGIIFDSQQIIQKIKLYSLNGKEFRVAHTVGDDYMGGYYTVCIGSFATRILKKIETREEFNEVLKVIPEALSVIDTYDCQNTELSTIEEEDLLATLANENDVPDSLREYLLKSWRV